MKQQVGSRSAPPSTKSTQTGGENSFFFLEMLGFKWDVSVWEILESKEWEREILNERHRSGNCGSDRHGSEMEQGCNKKKATRKEFQDPIGDGFFKPTIRQILTSNREMSLTMGNLPCMVSEQE